MYTQRIEEISGITDLVTTFILDKLGRPERQFDSSLKTICISSEPQKFKFYKLQEWFNADKYSQVPTSENWLVKKHFSTTAGQRCKSFTHSDFKIDRKYVDLTLEYLKDKEKSKHKLLESIQKFLAETDEDLEKVLATDTNQSDANIINPNIEIESKIALMESKIENMESSMVSIQNTLKAILKKLDKISRNTDN